MSFAQRAIVFFHQGQVAVGVENVIRSFFVVNGKLSAFDLIFYPLFRVFDDDVPPRRMRFPLSSRRSAKMPSPSAEGEGGPLAVDEVPPPNATQQRGCARKGVATEQADAAAGGGATERCLQLSGRMPPPRRMRFPLSSRRSAKKDCPTKRQSFFYGAGDEARTRYLDLGKVALYQMSYTRNACSL